jgi:hypothetical protein
VSDQLRQFRVAGEEVSQALARSGLKTTAVGGPVDVCPPVVGIGAQIFILLVLTDRLFLREQRIAAVPERLGYPGVFAKV